MKPMQLFITDFILHDSTITLTEERVIHQLKHVLRARVGTECKIQHTTGNTMIRYAIRISDIGKEKIIGHIIDEQKIILKDNNMYLIVALPNKFEKMELVVQKCTEIGIQHIVFFPSQYSQIRELSQNKIERLGKIALEAVEQSYGVVVPEIIFVKDIQSYLIQGDNIILHQDGESVYQMMNDSKKITTHFFIGPEGGRGDQDEKLFSDYPVKKISLGKNILRTETAAIVVAREAIRINN